MERPAQSAIWAPDYHEVPVWLDTRLSKELIVYFNFLLQRQRERECLKELMEKEVSLR